MNTVNFESDNNAPSEKPSISKGPKRLPEASPKTYFYTFLALILLLAASFLVAQINLGPLNTSAGFLIAVVKAILVGLYFMHLRYSNGLIRLAAAVGIFWLGIMIVLTLSDYESRNWLQLPSPWPQGFQTDP